MLTPWKDYTSKPRAARPGNLIVQHLHFLYLANDLNLQVKYARPRHGFTNLGSAGIAYKKQF